MTLFTPISLTPGPLDSFLIAGEQLQADIAEAVTDVVVERTIAGVTNVTVSVHDTARTLLKSELFRQRSVAKVDGTRFELAQVRKTGVAFDLVFEDVVVAELRRHKEPRTAAAGSTTRSAFIRRLVAVARGTVVGPDSPQALLEGFSTETGAAPTAAAAAAAAPVTGSLSTLALLVGGTGTSDTGAIPGISQVTGSTGGSDLDFLAGIWRLDFFHKHHATPQQIAKVAAAAGFTGDALITAVAIALAESSGNPNEISKPNTNGTVDRGLWQINSVHTQYDPDQLLVPSYNARAAFELSSGGTNFRPWTTFRLAPYPYNDHVAEATDAVASLTAAKEAAQPDTPVVADTTAIATAADPKTSEPKDWWTSIKALADEVQWRVFCDSGIVWFAPDPWLIGQPVYLEISEDSPGVDWIDFDFDIGKPRSTMTVQARASSWSIPPGVVIQANDLGVGTGRWLVSRVTKSLFSSAVTVELTQPQSQLPEPSHQPDPTQAATLGSPGASPSNSPSDSTRGRVKAMVTFAESKLGGEYVWGGDGPDNYDCSGLTHAAAASVGAYLARNTTAAWQQCTDAGTTIPIQQGINTYGAVLWIFPTRANHMTDHMAFSLGDGRTIEAMGTKWGIVHGDANRFDHAALVPDLKDEYLPHE